MIILVFLLPRLNLLIGLLFTSFVYGGIYFILAGNIFSCLLISKILLYKIVSTGNSYIISATFWVSIDVLKIKWCFLFDSLTAVMLVVIFFISFLVHLYFLDYMKTDPHVFRFISYLSLFTFFMIILVTSNNFLQMFVGWGRVGLSFYLLINFWNSSILILQKKNNDSVLKMFVKQTNTTLYLFTVSIIIFSIYNFVLIQESTLFIIPPVLPLSEEQKKDPSEAIAEDLKKFREETKSDLPSDNIHPEPRTYVEWIGGILDYFLGRFPPVTPWLEGSHVERLEMIWWAIMGERCSGQDARDAAREEKNRMSDDKNHDSDNCDNTDLD